MLALAVTVGGARVMEGVPVKADAVAVEAATEAVTFGWMGMTVRVLEEPCLWE